MSEAEGKCKEPVYLGCTGNVPIFSDDSAARKEAVGSAEEFAKTYHALYNFRDVLKFAEAYARVTAQPLVEALTEIDNMLDGGLPITHRVKSIAHAALAAAKELAKD